MPSAPAVGPLAGLRVVDLSTVVAGPFAAGLLADFGATVVKAELPGTGDALRALAPHKNGVSLWWKVTNRNKRGITLDLRHDAGRDLLARLLREADVLVENFRPGTLDRWGITSAWLREVNPRLTVLRVTGFGQHGPYASRPGFATMAEAMSGFAAINGEPPPLRGAGFGARGALPALAAAASLGPRGETGSAAGRGNDAPDAERLRRLATPQAEPVAWYSFQADPAR